MSRPARLNLSIDMSTTHDLGRFTRPHSSPVEPAPLRGLPSGRVGFTPLCFVHGLVG
jgi:hypothetical protein